MNEQADAVNVRHYREMQPRSEHPEQAPSLAPSGTLPLAWARLEVRARGGRARVVLVQAFDNFEREPLAVTYQLPLPVDAAVSGFAFVVKGVRTVGVVQRKRDARETYERAVANGQSAALLEQERANLFVQEIGNIPPGQRVEVEVTLDQPLAWVTGADRGQWEWRFPLAAAPRYLGAPATGPQIQVTQGKSRARAQLAMTVDDALTQHPESVSHPLQVHAREGGADVTLGNDNAVPLDRDLVVRWAVAGDTFASSVECSRGDDGAYGLLTLVPPRTAAQPRRLPRDLSLLLDTSGSMQGEPLEQEKRVACALIDALDDDDTLEMYEFSSTTRAFRAGAERASAALKREAIAWVQRLHASGGTEMVSGVQAALRTLRPGSQRQIVLITDGLVGFEEALVKLVLASLPASARLHAVGVGSAVNRAMVAPIARAGRGAEIVVGLGEDAERACARLLACTSAPLAVDLELGGSALRGSYPSRLPDVFAHAPLRAALALSAEGGELIVRGKTRDGSYEHRMQIAPITERRDSVEKAFARELVEEREMRLSGGEDRATVERDIERAGVDFQIATRLTSWVAVTDERTVDPRDPSRHVVQPHELAFGLHAEGLGLRAAAAPVLFGAAPQLDLGRVQAPARRSMAAPGSGAWDGPAAPPPPMPQAAAPRHVPAPANAPAAAPRKGESAPPAQAKRGATLLGRVMKFFAGKNERSGRIVRNDAERIIVAFDALGGVLAWHEWSVVVIAGGTRFTLLLLPSESSHERPVDAGLEIRAVLDASPLGGLPLHSVELTHVPSGERVLSFA